MGEALLPVVPEFENFIVLPGWLVGLYVSGVVYRKTLNLYRKFQLIGNFKVNLRSRNVYSKIHAMAGKQCFSAQGVEKVIFSETLAGISSLAQWTSYQL